MGLPQPTEVEVRVSSQGAITPLRFTWGRAWRAVAQVGRAWSDAEGEHWLIMSAEGGQVFELVRVPSGEWQVSPSQPSLA